MKQGSNLMRSLLLISCLFISINSFAQPHKMHHGKKNHPHGMRHKPGLEKHFYPSEMLMHHKSEINLTAEQQKFIIKATQEAQQLFTEKQWALQDAMEGMKKLIEVEKVDEKKVYAQLDKIFSIEQELKKKRLGLMIQIKNKLTTAQKKKLDAIKEKHKKEGRPMHKPGPPPRR